MELAHWGKAMKKMIFVIFLTLKSPSDAGMVLRRHWFDVFYGVFSVILNTAWPFLARLKG
jgi:hypothetical protein